MNPSKQIEIIAVPVTSVDCEGDEMTLTVDSKAFEEIHFLEKGVGMLLIAFVSEAYY